MTEKRIAWVTDSTAYITEELAAHPDVYVLPLSITFNKETFEDGVDLTVDQLYKRIRENKEVPKTSQPSAGKFAELYDSFKEKYDAAVSIHISSELSGTYSSAVQGQEISGFPVEVIDSLTMSYGITTLMHKGMEMQEQGKSVEEISTQLRSSAPKSESYILLGSLEQFYKGGRMSGTSYLLGNLLQIKPIIRITNEGKFDLFQKVRSEKKAIKRMIELLEQALEKRKLNEVQVMHGNVLEKAEDLKSRIKENFPDLRVVTGEISSTIAAHAGEGTLALIWNNDDVKSE
ncbi:DegV family protein [Alkalicoccus daliensis]|uniref:EDD domain protein, DegV family n=1 Tax=Alkalicoccus daliensis TaxID=745820 RepID=A0A1H0KPF5_9BACI|nr:DegV family protein [Alkalicoccus daliensis]SDO57745.1 EDD domain protein, DegV family [Alkalicoccus daliensis]